MVPGLPSLGGAELLILLAVVLLFFGAKRVPELGRSVGNGIREFRKGASEDTEDYGTRELKEGRKLPREEEEEEARLAQARAARTEHDDKDVRDERRVAEQKP